MASLPEMSLGPGEPAAQPGILWEEGSLPLFAPRPEERSAQLDKLWQGKGSLPKICPGTGEPTASLDLLWGEGSLHRNTPNHADHSPCPGGVSSGRDSPLPLLSPPPPECAQAGCQLPWFWGHCRERHHPPSLPLARLWLPVDQKEEAGMRGHH